jgi:hypothetical protein
MKKNILLLLFYTFCIGSHAQKKIEKEKNKVYSEGLALYTIILANWTSNDLYYEQEFPTGYVKGYLSYRDKGDTIKTIFWREIDTSSAEYKAKIFKPVNDTGVLAKQVNRPLDDIRVIVKTISYPKMTVNRRNAFINEEERSPTDKEKLLMDFRSLAYDAINNDTVFFKQYAGMFLRAVPFEAGKQIKVYIYSSTNREGVVPFGCDYLLVYDKKERMLIEKTDLHKDCLLISVGHKGKLYEIGKITQHTHSQGISNLITPTDIATLLLYKNLVQWDEHHVIGKKYVSIFTLTDRKLDVLPIQDYEKIKQKKIKIEEEEKKRKMQ